LFPESFYGDIDHQADSDSRSGSRPKLMWVGVLSDSEVIATTDVRNARRPARIIVQGWGNRYRREDEQWHRWEKKLSLVVKRPMWFEWGSVMSIITETKPYSVNDSFHEKSIRRAFSI
jgi:hypothetical protein